MLANTLFKCVCFGANGVHILTSGSDHKIGYWEVQNGAALRELEGSKTGSINAMDISADGTYYITGGEDRLVKVDMDTHMHAHTHIHNLIHHTQTCRDT